MLDNHPNTSISNWILAKNNQFIVVNKPSNIPVQADKTGDAALDQIMAAYCKQDLYVTHRIDRPASGIVLLAKNKKSLAHFNMQFQHRTTTKTYLALVAKTDIPETNELTHYIRKSGQSNKSKVTDSLVKDAKEAKLSYRIIESLDRYLLLEIDLITGRHHQIRAQLGHLGAPIKGDVKYGFKRSNPDRSIELHAWKLSINHPVTEERLTFEAAPPQQGLWKFLTSI